MSKFNISKLPTWQKRLLAFSPVIIWLLTFTAYPLCLILRAGIKGDSVSRFFGSKMKGYQAEYKRQGTNTILATEYYNFPGGARLIVMHTSDKRLFLWILCLKNMQAHNM